MINCHCRDCQRATGSAYAPSVIVPAAALTVEGDPTWFEGTADSGNMIKRAFCPTCGSRLFGESSGAPLIGIYAASLDDPSWFRPMAEVWTASAQPWDVMHPEAPRFPKAPPVPSK